MRRTPGCPQARWTAKEPRSGGSLKVGSWPEGWIRASRPWTSPYFNSRCAKMMLSAPLPGSSTTRSWSRARSSAWSRRSRPRRTRARSTRWSKVSAVRRTGGWCSAYLRFISSRRMPSAKCTAAASPPRGSKSVWTRSSASLSPSSPICRPGRLRPKEPDYSKTLFWSRATRVWGSRRGRRGTRIRRRTRRPARPGATKTQQITTPSTQCAAATKNTPAGPKSTTRTSDPLRTTSRGGQPRSTKTKWWTPTSPRATRNTSSVRRRASTKNSSKWTFRSRS